MDLLCLSELNFPELYLNLQNKKRNLVYIYNHGGGNKAIRKKKKKFPTKFNQLLYERYYITTEDWVTLFYLVGRYGSYHLFSLLVELSSLPTPIASDGSTHLHALSLNVSCHNFIENFIEKFNINVYKVNEGDYFGRSSLYYSNLIHIFLRSKRDMVDREGNTPVKYRIKTGRDQGLNLIAIQLDYDELLNIAAATPFDNVILALMNISGLTEKQIIDGYLTLGARNVYGAAERVYFVRAVNRGWRDDAFYGNSEELIYYCRDYITLRYGPYGPQMEMFLLSVMRNIIEKADGLILFKDYMDSLLHPECSFQAGDCIFEMWTDYSWVLDIVTLTKQFVDSPVNCRFLVNWFSRTLNTSKRKKLIPFLYEAAKFRNDADQTLLHLVCEMKQKQPHCISPLRFITLCLSAGADIDAKDKFGNTPLHYVTRNPNAMQKRMCTLLLSKGAHQDACNNRGRMACKQKVFPLKCLSARVVHQNCINTNTFPDNFVKFVNLH